MPTVYLALGSNLGDRGQNIKRALELLSQKVKIEKVSPLYETEPEGLPQPSFLNAICSGKTELSPKRLLILAKEIEGKLGRKPNTSGLPRPIDIDILFYDSLVLKTADLIIPHPKLIYRAFVLIPLCDIAPDLVHPEVGKTVKELVLQLSRGDVRRVKCLR